jgi:hypothetical protein
MQSTLLRLLLLLCTLLHVRGGRFSLRTSLLCRSLFIHRLVASSVVMMMTVVLVRRTVQQPHKEGGSEHAGT